MFRVHLTSDDLARVRILGAPEPLAEVAESVRTLQRRDHQGVFGPWRKVVRPQLSRTAISPLLDLVPADDSEPLPGFLARSTGAPTLEAGLARLREDPDRIAADLAALRRVRTLPAWTRALEDGDLSLIDLLTVSLRAYHQTAVAPFWQQIAAALHAEIAERRRVMAEQGVEGLLATLHPSVRWHAPVLELPHTESVDVRPEGRGLLIRPALFRWPRVSIRTGRDGEGSPLELALPIPLNPETCRSELWRAEVGAGPLSSLLGRTRAAVLEAVAVGSTTSELGRRLGITPAAASQHATVLRAAGLITTRRQGGSAHHALTPLGVELTGGRSSRAYP